MYPKRYFIINFTNAVLIIQHDRIQKRGENIKEIMFRDI